MNLAEYLDSAHWPVSAARIEAAKNTEYRAWDAPGGYPETLERYSGFHTNIAFNLAVKPEDIHRLNADQYQPGRLLLHSIFIGSKEDGHATSEGPHLDDDLRVAMLGFLEAFPSMQAVQGFVDHYEQSEYAGQDEDILALKRSLGEQELGDGFYPIFRIDIDEFRVQLDYVIAMVVGKLVDECHDENCEGGGEADLTDIWVQLDRIAVQWHVPDHVYRHIHACWDCWCQATGIEGQYKPNMYEIDLRSKAKKWRAPRNG